MCLSGFVALGLVLRSTDHWVPHYLLACVYETNCHLMFPVAYDPYLIEECEMIL